MGAWPGKYVIGLTGNIATGKSVVRKMLEHQGAYGIDADALAHRVIAKGGPGYAQVIETFGSWMLRDDDQVDRARLGKVVFSDPEALRRLEAIVHPYVRQAIDLLVNVTPLDVVVIEAIKLVESPLREMVDAIWVVTANEALQLARLMRKRGMDEAAARQRIELQNPEADKLAIADAVIENTGSIEDIWTGVRRAWKAAFPETLVDTGPVQVGTTKVEATAQVPSGRLAVVRASPRQAEEIAKFISEQSGGRRELNRDEVMATFGEKAYMLLMAEDQIMGLVGWQVENLVARSDEVLLHEGLVTEEVLPILVAEVERASKELQSEISLVFVSRALVGSREMWRMLGYEEKSPDSLPVGAWREAANESMADDCVMLFKQLRVDRILRPI